MFPLIARLAMDREMEIRRQAARSRPQDYLRLQEETGPRIARSKPAPRWLMWLSRRQRRECTDCC